MAGDVQRVQSYESEDIEAENSGVGQRISPDGRDEVVVSAPQEPGLSNLKLALLPVVTAGVGFGWALQLALLTPYIQTLGVEHEFSSFVWLCGPIAGLVVQPIVGLWTDRCTSKWGRRRPYIFSGVLLIMLAVTVIGFGSDIGSLLGDAKEISCQVFRGKRSRAASVVILGFWLLDIAANTVDPPLRALLADVSGSDQQRVVAGNAVYTLWGALGSVLGYSAGSYGHWHKLFPSLLTKSCCAPCANLKAAFLLQIALLLITASITLVVAKETPLSIDGQSPATKQTETGRTSSLSKLARVCSLLVSLLQGVRKLPKSMTYVLVVMALSWFSWFPFFLYDTDWMGREVYEGDPHGNGTQVAAYERGVEKGAFGLLLNSVVSGMTSLVISGLCRMLGSKNVWAVADLVLCVAFVCTELIRRVVAGGHRKRGKVGAVVLFAALGFPWAITLTVPYSITAQLTANSGGGQVGLAMGILNLAIVIPQTIVTLGAGPWDELFGGGNEPTFGLAALLGLGAAVVAVWKLPKPSGIMHMKKRPLANEWAILI